MTDEQKQAVERVRHKVEIAAGFTYTTARVADLRTLLALVEEQEKQINFMLRTTQEFCDTIYDGNGGGADGNESPPSELAPHRSRGNAPVESEGSTVATATPSRPTPARADQPAADDELVRELRECGLACDNLAGFTKCVKHRAARRIEELGTGHAASEQLRAQAIEHWQHHYKRAEQSEAERDRYREALREVWCRIPSAVISGSTWWKIKHTVNTALDGSKPK